MNQPFPIDGPSSAAEAHSSIFFQKVLTEAAEGDSDAAQEIYRRFAQQLLQLASGRISEIFNSKIDADDIVQSVFKSFFYRHQKSELTFRSWDEIWSFLMTVTIRKCCAKANWFLRDKRNVNREYSQTSHEPGFDGEQYSPATRGPTPYQVAVFDDLLTQFFAPLSEMQRQIVLMRMSGHSNREISEKLNRTERTIYRTLELLKSQMNKIYDAID